MELIPFIVIVIIKTTTLRRPGQLLVIYYRKFVLRFSALAAPLTALKIAFSGYNVKL